MRRTPVVLLCLTPLVLPLAACGDDDDDDGNGDGGGSAPAGAVTVVAESINGFDSDSYEATAGEVTIVFENDDSIPHNVTIEDEDFQLDDDGEQGTIDLEAGDYTLFCDIPGHRAAGMEATLAVG
jgi:plastocyanin